MGVIVRKANTKDKGLQYEANVRYVASQTLAVLIHRALGRAHSGVRWPHTGALHGPTMDIFHNPLVVHAIHGLKDVEHIG